VNFSGKLGRLHIIFLELKGRT